MTSFATILREGAAQHQAEVEARLAREAREAQAIIAEVLAPHYARGWDRALTPFAATASRAPGANPVARRRAQPLREKMGPGRRQPRRDERDDWDMALREFGASAAEIEAHRRAMTPDIEQISPEPSPTFIIAPAPADRVGASSRRGALARIWDAALLPFAPIAARRRSPA